MYGTHQVEALTRAQVQILKLAAVQIDFALEHRQTRQRPHYVQAGAAPPLEPEVNTTHEARERPLEIALTRDEGGFTLAQLERRLRPQLEPTPRVLEQGLTQPGAKRTRTVVNPFLSGHPAISRFNLHFALNIGQLERRRRIC